MSNEDILDQPLSLSFSKSNKRRLVTSGRGYSTKPLWEIKINNEIVASTSFSKAIRAYLTISSFYKRKSASVVTS